MLRYTGIMKLIGRYDSPFVRRVGITLHVLGQPFEHLPLSPFSQAAELRRYATIGRMPVLVLDDGEALIESAAILDYLDQMVGPLNALVPTDGIERRNALKILACATAACDKAVAINYERRRPTQLIFDDWIGRCQLQLNAALSELEAVRLQPPNNKNLRQIDITTACALAYIRRVEPNATQVGRYPLLEAHSSSCEIRDEFMACPQ